MTRKLRTPYTSQEPIIPAEDNAANRRLTEELIAVAAEQGTQAARLLWEIRPEGVDVLEFVLRRRGFDLLDQGRAAAGIAVLELNLQANPNSPRASQALAEGYMETDRPELAVRYFEACLALEPENSFGINTLERLRSQLP